MKDFQPSFSAHLALAYPARDPSPDLRARILAGKKPRFARRTLRIAYATFAMTAVGLGSVFIGPKAEAYAALRRIEGAADALPYWHLSSYTPDVDGNWVMSAQSWGEGNRVRDDREFGHSVMFSEGDVRMSWRPGEDHAVRNVISGRHSSGVSKLSGFIQELQASTSLLGLAVDSDVSVEGRRATRVTALAKDEPVRTRIYADPVTEVPFLATIEVQSDSGWRIERRCEIDTTHPTVALSLPAGVRVVNQSDLEHEMESRFEKPLTTLGSVNLRDVWMNKDGVIFVLYTNGGSFKPIDTSAWKEIKLSNGQVVKQGPAVPQSQLEAKAELVGIAVAPQADYVPIEGFQGAEYFTDGRFVKGLRWANGDAMVGVYAPITPIRTSEKVELEFGRQSWKIFSDLKSKGKSVGQGEMIQDKHVVGVWKTSLAPHLVSLPEWADQIGMASTGRSLDMEVARVRSEAAIRRGDGVEAEAQARLYLRVTQMQAAESGNSYAMYPMYEQIGKALALEGKTAEARTMYQKALGDAHDMSADQIRRELDALPGAPR